MGSKKIPINYTPLSLALVFVSLLFFLPQISSGQSFDLGNDAFVEQVSPQRINGQEICPQGYSLISDETGSACQRQSGFSNLPEQVPHQTVNNQQVCPDGYRLLTGGSAPICQRNDIFGPGTATEGGVFSNTVGVAPRPPTDNTVKCESFSDFFSKNFFTCVAYSAGSVILWFLSKIVYLAGILLDTSIYISILSIKTYFDNPSINIIWSTVRDLGNILFIFFLLWISIQTILGFDNAKNHLASIIIAALLVNFSFFFTKVIIDASNIVAVQFYSQMVPENCARGDLINFDGCLSSKIMAATQLSSIYNSGKNNNPDSIKLNIPNVVIITIMGSIFLLTVAFAFLIAAFMFVARTVMFVLLAAVSPIAFVTKIIPQTKKYADEWWKMLMDQALVAPIFLFLMWIVTMLAQTQTAQLGGERSLFGGSQIEAASLGSAFLGDGGASKAIFSFLFLIMLMFFTIKITRQYSGSIGGAFVKFGTQALGAVAGGAGGMALRGTVGRGASFLSKKMGESEGMKNFAARNPLLGKMLFSSVKGVAGSSMDVRGAQETLQKTPYIGGAAKLFGTAAGATGANLDLGRVSGKGGFQKALDDRTREEMKYVDTLKGKTAEGEDRRKAYAKKQFSGVMGSVWNRRMKQNVVQKLDKGTKTRDEKEKEDEIKKQNVEREKLKADIEDINQKMKQTIDDTEKEKLRKDREGIFEKMADNDAKIADLKTELREAREEAKYRQREGERKTSDTGGGGGDKKEDKKE